MNKIREIQIPRYCTVPNSEQYLCVYSDASNSGYSSTAYIVSVLPGQTPVCNLLCSKTKLAPLSTVRTIPQLELAGIELSAKLINWLLTCDLPFHFKAIYGFSDSMIALAYLNIPVSKLKVYVANRVSNIHKLTENQNVKWLYCPTNENPSDLSCRGLTPENLLNNQLWFHGPASLKTSS